jgi:Holliday junction DNA helicase RuvA
VIGWLRGEVVARHGDHSLVLSVRDVGYDVQVPTSTLTRLQIGDPVDLFIAMKVRDDAIVLYGFEDPRTKETFEALIATPGVGPATALAALSLLSPEQLETAVQSEDVTALARVPGIGKKTAARLVLELAGKLTRPETTTVGPTVRGDVESALRQLGYAASEIRVALEGVELPEDDEGALRVALRQLGRR